MLRVWESEGLLSCREAEKFVKSFMSHDDVKDRSDLISVPWVCGLALTTKKLDQREGDGGPR